MNKANRQRLLAFARFLDRRASGIRNYVKRVTPKRARNVVSPEAPVTHV